MTISPNKIIGSLAYRTRVALDKDARFLNVLQQYFYSKSCYLDDLGFLLWYYPGTNNEISNALLEIGKHPQGARLKFPAIFNFQPIRQEKRESATTIYYNLAIVGAVKSSWMTQEREEQVFRCVLRPIYNEFMKQIKNSGYFNLDYGTPSHTYYEIFTTGESAGEMIKKYGDNIDAIELHNLALTLKPNICTDVIQRIESENEKAYENVKKVLNYNYLKNDWSDKK